MSLLLKHKGVRLTLAGADYVFAPLPVASLVEGLPRLKDLEAATRSGDLQAVANYAHMVAELATVSLRRNYPSITLEQVSNELLDAGNLGDVVTAMLDVSGAVRKAQDAGEWHPAN